MKKKEEKWVGEVGIWEGELGMKGESGKGESEREK